MGEGTKKMANLIDGKLELLTDKNSVFVQQSMSSAGVSTQRTNCSATEVTSNDEFRQMKKERME